MSKVSIIGGYNTAFGSFVKKDKEKGTVTDLKSIYDLMIEAGKGAIADAGIEASDVDAVWVGSCAPGLFANQEHLAAAAVEIAPEALRLKPMNRAECACVPSNSIPAVIQAFDNTVCPSARPLSAAVSKVTNGWKGLRLSEARSAAAMVKV